MTNRRAAWWGRLFGDVVAAPLVAPDSPRRQFRPQDSIADDVDFQALVDRRDNGLGRLTIGPGSVVHGHVSIVRDSAEVRIGSNCYVNRGTVIWADDRVTIGNDVLISFCCVIADSDGHNLALSRRQHDVAKLRKRWATVLDPAIRPVTIEDGAWMGAYCIVLKGVRVGRGAIVGAGSVVTRDVPDWTIVGGNPARLIREIPADQR